MANPLIEVIKAVYGRSNTNNPPVDVTESIQGTLDSQYNQNPNLTQFVISTDCNTWTPPGYDPNRGLVKTLIITYIHLSSGCLFILGNTQSKDPYININIHAPASCYWSVLSAGYASRNVGVDLTNKFQKYLSDPLILANPYKFNSIVIGSQDFFNLFTNGKDPDWGVSKHFMFSYVDDKGQVRDIIRNDGDLLSLLP